MTHPPITKKERKEAVGETPHLLPRYIAGTILAYESLVMDLESKLSKCKEALEICDEKLVCTSFEACNWIGEPMTPSREYIECEAHKKLRQTLSEVFGHE